MQPIRKFSAALICSAVLLAGFCFFTACGKATLEAGGAYTHSVTNTVGTNTVITTVSDLQLYQADAAFATAYKAADAICTFELKNRAYLWNLSPNIKHTVDKIRPQVWEAQKEYTSARAAYIANPTPTGLTGIDAVVAQIQQLLVAATAAMAVGASTNSPATATP